jgi:hypothetical protein
MVGLMPASAGSRTAWAPCGHRRAVSAQRLGRRVERGLQNQRREGHQVDGPRLQRALAEGGAQALHLALDTSTLWERDGRVRLALM